MLDNKLDQIADNARDYLNACSVKNSEEITRTIKEAAKYTAAEMAFFCLCFVSNYPRYTNNAQSLHQLIADELTILTNRVICHTP